MDTLSPSDPLPVTEQKQGTDLVTLRTALPECHSMWQCPQSELSHGKTSVSPDKLWI